jgi:hypothetical protein
MLPLPSALKPKRKATMLVPSRSMLQQKKENKACWSKEGNGRVEVTFFATIKKDLM